MAAHQHKRVLLVNGDLLSRETVVLTLPRPEYSIVRVQATDIALDILRRSSKPVIVIVDFSVTNWQASAEFMKICSADGQLARHHKYILLLTTNETMPLNIGQAISVIQPIMAAKPFSPEQLLGAVQAAERQLPHR